MENELITLGCLIPGTWQQLVHTSNEAEMRGEQKVRFLEDMFCRKNTLFVYDGKLKTSHHSL